MTPSLISPSQCRAARQSLGVSLKRLSEDSSVNRSYLSMFENGKMPLSSKCQQALSGFFKSRGIDLEALTAESEDTPQAAAIARGLLGRAFFLSNDLPQELYDRVIAAIETHDERISELLVKPIKSGMFSGWSPETETDQQELFGLLAANYLLFRMLQGHDFVSPRDEDIDPQTVADLLADWFSVTLNEIQVAPEPGPVEGEEASHG